MGSIPTPATIENYELAIKNYETTSSMDIQKTFIFQGYDAHIEKGEIAFHYCLQLPEKEITFTENISFPPVFIDIPQKLLESLLHNLLLILGISYWKTYCPKNIEINPFKLTKQQAKFWNIVYTKGLGEFFYKNNIDYRGLVSFPFQENITTEAITFPRKNR